MSTPDPATTEWVPLWGLTGGGSGSASLTYKGAWSAGQYNEGDIVVDGGVVYMAQIQTNRRPSGNWPLQSTPITLPRVTSAQMTALVPFDGMEIGLAVDDTNGIVWHLRYNANSASAYKWEFVGGPPLYSTTGGTSDSTTTTGSWITSASSPTITAPRAGDYITHCGAEAAHSAAAGIISIGVAAGDTTPPEPWASFYEFSSNYYQMISTGAQLPAVAAGTVMKIRLFNSNAGTAAYLRRWMDAIPVRLS